MIKKITSIELNKKTPFEHEINFFTNDMLVSSEPIKAYLSDEAFNKVVNIWLSEIWKEKQGKINEKKTSI